LTAPYYMANSLSHCNRPPILRKCLNDRVRRLNRRS
jgi:hypothetical protein